jgi:hypothetical protein
MAKVLLLSPPYLDLYGRHDDPAGPHFLLGLGSVGRGLSQARQGVARST